MAALQVRWQSVTTIVAPKRVVVTGDEDGEVEAPTATETGPQLKWIDRPILVYVCDDASACADSEKFEDIVLADEKIAIGVRAFRCIKMTPDQVSADAILADHGTATPRVLCVEPTKMKVKVLESKNLKASKLYKTMKSVAGKFWKEKLDSVVKSHLKLLTEQDRLANADKTLADKEERAADDDKKLAKVKAERKEIRKELAELSKQQGTIWKLTPKAT